MAASRGNHGKDEGLSTLHGNVHDLAQRLPLVQVRSFGVDGLLHHRGEGPSMIVYVMMI